MKVLGVVVVVLVALFGCNENPAGPSDVMGETWRLVSIEPAASAPITVSGPSRYTIQFMDGQRVSIRADCNTCSGSFTRSGTAFSIGALACTRAFCGDGSLDNKYMEALGSARSLVQTGSQLTIRGDSATLQFKND